jgi:hypothetical protein
MGFPSSHSTTLVSFSFFWLQMSLSKPCVKPWGTEVGCRATRVDLKPGKSAEDLGARLRRGFAGLGFQGTAVLYLQHIFVVIIDVVLGGLEQYWGLNSGPHT